VSILVKGIECVDDLWPHPLPMSIASKAQCFSIPVGAPDMGRSPLGLHLLWWSMSRWMDAYPESSIIAVDQFCQRFVFLPPLVQTRFLGALLTAAVAIATKEEIEGVPACPPASEPSPWSRLTSIWECSVSKPPPRLSKEKGKEKGNTYLTEPPAVLPPQDLLARVSDRVIGLTQAKETLALRLTLQARARQQRHASQGAICLDTPGPVLVLGETGSGKTFLVEEMSKAAGLPFISVDAASMVPEGIVGTTLSDVALALLSSLKNASDAEYAVICLDEIDKLMTGAHYGDRVLIQLLRAIEGGTLHIDGHHLHDRQDVTLVTRNIFWVFCGSFQQMRDTIVEEAAGAVGFAMGDASRNQGLPMRTSALLERCGLPRELRGRIERIITLPPPTVSDIERILSLSTASPVAVQRRHLAGFGAEVSIEPAAVRRIAEVALDEGTGIRGLRTMVARLFEPHLSRAATTPGYRAAITVDEVALLNCLSEES